MRHIYMTLTILVTYGVAHYATRLRRRRMGPVALVCAIVVAIASRIAMSKCV